MLNGMIQLSHKLIAENGDDKTKEIVFRRLRQEGRTSITEGDASAHLEPPVGTAWSTMPPPPAGAAAASCAIAPLRRARSSSSCAEADGFATAAALPLQLLQLQKDVSTGSLTELSSCRSSRSSTCAQSRPAAPHEADGPATTATPPARHEADGSATAAAPPRGRHEEETPRDVIMHDAAEPSRPGALGEQSRGRQRDKGSREGSRKRRHGCKPGRGGVRGSKIMLSWRNRELSKSSSEADDSVTAAAKLERAASSGPPSPAITAPPATPVRLRRGESPVNPDLQDGAATPVRTRRLESLGAPINIDLQDHDPTEYASSEELEPRAEPEAERKSNPDIARYVKEMPLRPGHEAAPAPRCAPVTPSAHSLDSPAGVRTPSPALQESRYGMLTPTADEQANVEPDGATSPGLIPAEPAEVPSPTDLGTAVPSLRGSTENQEPEAEQINAPPGLAVPLKLADDVPEPTFLPLASVELNFNIGDMETDPWFAHSHDDLSAWQRRTTSQIHIQSFPTQPGMRYLRKTLTVDRCQQN